MDKTSLKICIKITEIQSRKWNIWNIRKVKKSAKGEDKRIASGIFIFSDPESEKNVISTIHL